MRLLVQDDPTLHVEVETALRGLAGGLVPPPVVEVLLRGWAEVFAREQVPVVQQPEAFASVMRGRAHDGAPSLAPPFTGSAAEGAAFGRRMSWASATYLRAHLARYREARLAIPGLDPSTIHALHAGDPKEVVLTMQDLVAVLHLCRDVLAMLEVFDQMEQTR